MARLRGAQSSGVVAAGGCRTFPAAALVLAVGRTQTTGYLVSQYPGLQATLPLTLTSGLMMHGGADDG
jgi:hypothetical protein